MNSTTESNVSQNDVKVSIEDEIAAAEKELEAAQARVAELKAKSSPASSPQPSQSELGQQAQPQSNEPASGQQSQPSVSPKFQPQPQQQPSASPQSPASSQGYQQPSYARPYQPAYQQQTAAQPSSYWQAPNQVAGQAADQPFGQAHPYQQPAYTYQQPSQPPYAQPAYAQPVAYSKDHVAAGLLAIFLGALGIHKFYLGYNTAGFIMLAISVAASFITFGAAAVVMAIIAIIEGIIYLTKSQTEFEQIYVFNKKEWF